MMPDRRSMASRRRGRSRERQREQEQDQPGEHGRGLEVKPNGCNHFRCNLPVTPAKAGVLWWEVPPTLTERHQPSLG